MFDRRRKRDEKPYRSRKYGIKDENIDRQIRVLHAAMVEKLLQHPALVEQARTKVEERKELGKMRWGAYITWLSILELTDRPDLFRQAILEDSPKMRKLRRFTPLVGILTEEERQQALQRYACGEISIESLL